VLLDERADESPSLSRSRKPKPRAAGATERNIVVAVVRLQNQEDIRFTRSV
jgi:hypothetical protein